MNTDVLTTIERLSEVPVSEERRQVLRPLIDYIQAKVDAAEQVKLNFICTHNSRRSQLSQVWAQMAAHYFGLDVACYSGGVEVTAFNERAVEAIRRAGFQVEKSGQDNPKYAVSFSEDVSPVLCFSKLYDDAANPTTGFAAVMTCSDADENCPFIPGTEKRIPVRYEDPKAFDGTKLEQEKYKERSEQIASEMLYVFSQVKS